MSTGLFLLIVSFLFVLIVGTMVYLYWAQQQTISDLLEPYNLYILIDQLPNFPRNNQKDIKYFWDQFTMYLADLRAQNYSDPSKGITKEVEGSILSGGYSMANFLFLLMQRDIVNWPEFLNNYFNNISRYQDCIGQPGEVLTRWSTMCLPKN
jgi:predicted PurR-regulated permease PerM